ncbi:MAG: FAD-dependent oxidoreductase, partial [Defluviitaleaceae bacterium]|nr:FAD-dependent oxidoreductase [Defluviitaleaceae bacterium]
AVVVGGGFIGVEVAENLTDAGIRVTIVELSNQLLAPFDMDAACEIHGYIKQRGVALSLGCAVNKISWGGGRLALETSRGPLAADMVIMAAGVVPESALASKAGLDVNSRAGIIVDETMRTSDACIYAVGDAVETFDFFTGQASMVPLAGPAAKQARIAADNICGIRSVYDGTQGSAVIKIFGKTAAATGLSEKSAKRLGIECDKQFLYLPDRAAYYPGSEMISMKVVYEKPSGKILGAQVFGPEGAVKRCDALAVAIRAGMDADDLAKLELCYSPPYSNAKDPVNIAGFAIGNALSGRVKNFHWHDVDAVLQEGGATCVDVRDARECREGMIDGFVNIPLGELRDKLGGLDKSKKVYVCCQSGARSYAASRILSQNGFEVYNLCGGYRLYRAVKSN